jgi:hypothetical protein
MLLTPAPKPPPKAPLRGSPPVTKDDNAPVAALPPIVPKLEESELGIPVNGKAAAMIGPKSLANKLPKPVLSGFDLVICDPG